MADVSDISSLSREDLYEKIWSMPATKLAELYSVPYADVLSLCDKRQVPRPPTGFWSKIRHGARIERVPLPKEASVVSKVRAPRVSPIRLKRKIREEVAAEKFDAEVQQDSRELHPLVAKTYRVFRDIRPDQTDRLKSKEASLHIYVGYRGLDRAMRIADCIFRQLEALGHTVRIEKEPQEQRWITQAVIHGVGVSFHIEESIAKRTLPLTEKETWPSRNFEYETTGELKFLIDDYLGDWQRKSWSDAKHSRLEDKIPSILESLCAAAEILRKRKEEANKQKAIWQENEMRRLEQERKAAQRRIDTEKLDSQSQAWEKAERIRRFVRSFKTALEEKVGAVSAEEMIGEWVGNSLGHADAIDPIVLSLNQLDKSHE